jgi:DNA replication protein DnaC
LKEVRDGLSDLQQSIKSQAQAQTLQNDAKAAQVLDEFGLKITSISVSISCFVMLVVRLVCRLTALILRMRRWLDCSKRRSMN